MGADINTTRITTFSTGSIYETPMELNRYNHALTCYEEIGKIPKSYEATYKNKP
ncbi:MAG: hypothetical protein LBG19_13260 [Prevotellaceae bacterium]|jgi:hypothetical protein|nr:hypothetical protein [Prevotellaceae bacterium]